MSIMNDVLAEIKAEEEQVEKTNQAPAEDPKPAEEPKPAEDPKPADEPNPEDKSDDDGGKPAEDAGTTEDDAKKPPKDTSQFTKEEKAEHAFKRQLARQKEKHQEEMQNLIKSFDQKLEDFKQSLKPQEKKAQPKREDFEYDDDFVNALVKYNMEQEQAAKDEEAAKTRKEQEAAEEQKKALAEQQQAMADTFNSNISTAIPEEEREDFSAKVKLATENGLAGLLDQAPAVRNFIFTTKRGPKLLHAMLKERDIFANVMRTAATSPDPMATYIELDDIARNFEYKKPDPAPGAQQEPQRTMPKLGKPGSGGTKESAMDVTSDDQALIRLMRSKI